MDGRTVMVVDDDEDNALVLEAALQLAGFEVSVARSLHDARSRLMETPVEVLVSDYSLGDGDAIQLMSALGPKRPPVAILVTGYGGVEDRERSRAAGFDAHLVKPVAFDQLERTIREKLEKLPKKAPSEPAPPM
jgi:DNA-binding NtrC family response regulator